MTSTAADSALPALAAAAWRIRRYALRMAKAIENEEPDLVITDCSLASLRILKEHGRPALHPIQALAVAYGLDDVPGLAGASAPTAEDSP